jgi:hypothetical protein
MEIQNSGFRIKILNEKGIALVMVLILAMISLAIVSAMLFMATQGTVISGAQKFYGTAEEASTGAAELSTLYLSTKGTFNLLSVGITSGCNCGDPMNAGDNTDLSAGGDRTCRCDKLCNSKDDWVASADDWSCDENTSVAGLQVDLNPAANPDFTFALGNYTVFTKVVDTVRGNTDLGSIVTSGELGGSAVSSGAGGIITPPHSPYLYRMEVQAQATANPRELSRISVLYAH